MKKSCPPHEVVMVMSGTQNHW